MSAEPTTLVHPLSVPAAGPVARIAARDTPVRVLQMGPALDVQGGVSAVEQLICDYLPAYVDIRHLETTTDGAWWGRGGRYARALYSLWRALDTADPTLVHIHFASRGSTLRKMLLAQMVIHARRPLILHAHGGGFDGFHRRLPSVLKRMVNRTLQQANLVITLSTQWREFYIRECELAPSQVVALPNPVCVPTKIVDRSGRSSVRFIHLGKLGPAKGSHDLVKAFLALPPALRARARLLLAGNGDIEGIRRAVAGESGIEVRSWVTPVERDRLLRESDVFVLPSHAEGLPMSLLEAMASGLPAITTPVGGVPDVVTHGAEGMLIGPGNVTELGTAMAMYLNDEALRLAAGRRAHDRVRGHDVHAYARRLAALYQRIAPVSGWRAEA